MFESYLQRMGVRGGTMEGDTIGKWVTLGSSSMACGPRSVERTTLSTSAPPLCALGKRREDYVGSGHLSRSPFHHGHGGDILGQKTVTKGRWLCKFEVYSR